jgi:hypothetical protein
LSNGEFVHNADAVDYYGSSFMHALNAKMIPRFVDYGPSFIHALNAMRIPRFVDGGDVGHDVAAAQALHGLDYEQESFPRTDCSGAVSQVIDASLGIRHTGGMNTRDAGGGAEGWLTARGFVPGEGGEGEMTVYWYNDGPGSNDGHMFMRLSDGAYFESGQGHGPLYGVAPDFTKMTYAMHRPAYPAGEGDGGGESPSYASGGGTGSALSPSGTGSGGGGGGSAYTVPSAVGGGGGYTPAYGPGMPGGTAPGNPWTGAGGAITDPEERRRYEGQYRNWQAKGQGIRDEIAAATRGEAEDLAEWNNALKLAGEAQAQLDALKAQPNFAAEVAVNPGLEKQVNDLTEKVIALNNAAQAEQSQYDAAKKRLNNSYESADEYNFAGPPQLPKDKKKEKEKYDKDAQELGKGLVKGIFEGIGFTDDVFGTSFTEWGAWKLMMKGLGTAIQMAFPEGSSIAGLPQLGNRSKSVAQGAVSQAMPGTEGVMPGLQLNANPLNMNGMPHGQSGNGMPADAIIPIPGMTPAANGGIPAVSAVAPGSQPLAAEAGYVSPASSITPQMAASQTPAAANGPSTGMAVNINNVVNASGLTTPQMYEQTHLNAQMHLDRSLPSMTPANGGAGLPAMSQ